MELHKYHTFLLPILLKLYQESKNDSYIDVTDCFTGTAEQNAVVFRNLNQSEFAIVKKEARVLLSGRKYKPAKFITIILPLGIEYIESFSEEFQKQQKKIPPIEFKTKK
jgi:hypothetical protein